MLADLLHCRRHMHRQEVLFELYEIGEASNLYRAEDFGAKGGVNVNVCNM